MGLLGQQRLRSCRIINVNARTQPRCDLGRSYPTHRRRHGRKALGPQMGLFLGVLRWVMVTLRGQNPGDSGEAATWESESGRWKFGLAGLHVRLQPIVGQVGLR